MFVFVTARERLSLSLRRKKPKAGLSFLSCCVYCSETSFGRNCAIYDLVECSLLYQCPFCSFKVWPVQTDWNADWQRADAEYSVPRAAVDIPCQWTSLAPTAMNISRLIASLSVHSSVASGSIISECTHYLSLTVLHCNTLTLCAHMSWGWCMYTLKYLSVCCTLFLVIGTESL